MCAVVTQRVVEHRDRRALDALGIDEHAQVRELRIVAQLVVVLHRHVPDAARGQQRQPSRGGERGHALRDDAGDIGALREAVGGVEAGEFGQVECHCQIGRRRHRDRQVTVRRRVDARRPRSAPARKPVRSTRCRRARAVHPRRHRFGLQVDRRLQQAAFDQPTLPGALTRQQRSQGAHRQQRCGVLVDDDRAGRCRRPVGATGACGESGTRLQQQFLPRQVAIGPAGAIAADRCVDDARVEGLDLLIAQAQPRHRAGTEVLHHHVCPFDQLARDRLAGFRLHVECHAALVATGRQQVDALARDEVVGDRPVAVKGAIERLHRDHVGTHIGQQLGRHRAAWKWLKLMTLKPESIGVPEERGCFSG